MPPAARVGDMHTCPMVDPGPKPHVGGPIMPPGAVKVLVGGQPAARVTDKAVCIGPPDMIMKGSLTVLIDGLFAARQGDPTVHGGVITVGFPMVMIGDGGATLVGGQPIMGSTQAQRASDAYNNLSPEERAKMDTLLMEATSDNERLWLMKGLAAGHSPDQLAPFAQRIRGQDEAWQAANLRLSGAGQPGITQQYQMSCNATTAQAVRGERDPLYALQVHDQNPNFASAPNPNNPTAVNPNMAAEQAAMLSSNYNGARGNMGGGTLDPINSTNPNPVGRWNDDLLNNQSTATGLNYTPQNVGANIGGAPTVTNAQAMNTINESLARGDPVPLVVGNAPGQSAHYVTATSMNAGNPPTYNIHDPATGQTTAVTAQQMQNGTMGLPSGWNQITGMEVPSAAP